MTPEAAIEALVIQRVVEAHAQVRDVEERTKSVKKKIEDLRQRLADAELRKEGLDREWVEANDGRKKAVIAATVMDVSFEQLGNVVDVMPEYVAMWGEME